MVPPAPIVVEAGRQTYARILESFVAREAEMMACLDGGERQAFVDLLNKVIEHSGGWAKPY